MYGKIFESVFTGTLFGSGPTVFAVWAYVIASAKPPGIVELNPKLLAACIGTDIGAVRDAIALLCAPDPDSRNQDHEGRRLLHLGGFQYQVVSFRKYRELVSLEDKRAADRERIAEKRRRNATLRDTARQDATGCDMSQDVATCRTESRPVVNVAEAEAEAEEPPPIVPPHSQPANIGRNPRAANAALRARSWLSPAFDKFWQAYPRKEGKKRAQEAFARIKPDDALLDRMLAALERAKASSQWRKDNGEYIPHPATWLNGRRWEDEPPDKLAGSAEQDALFGMPRISPATGLPNWV